MRVKKIGAVFLILLFILPTGCLYTRIRDGSYRDRETVELGDAVFHNEFISIPLHVKVEGGSKTLFKTKENIQELADRFQDISSPQITVTKQEQNYFLIEVDENGDVCNGIVYEVTDTADPMKGWHYYMLDGFSKSVNLEEGYIFLYWPQHFFPLPLHASTTPLQTGKAYKTSATIDDFADFYQHVSNQHGLTFEKKGNTITLPNSFFCEPYHADYQVSDMRVTLTFIKNGKVKIEIDK